MSDTIRIFLPVAPHGFLLHLSIVSPTKELIFCMHSPLLLNVLQAAFLFTRAYWQITTEHSIILPECMTVFHWFSRFFTIMDIIPALWVNTVNFRDSLLDLIGGQ